MGKLKKTRYSTTDQNYQEHILRVDSTIKAARSRMKVCDSYCQSLSREIYYDIIGQNPSMGDHQLYHDITDCVQNCGDHGQGTHSDNEHWRSACYGSCTQSILT